MKRVGRFWQASFSPLRRWTMIEPLAVKQALQQTMAQWGRPERIRMDNGMPWGTQRAVPSALALWLVGLAILPIYGRPGCSTDNAVVERSHGVLAQWVEPSTCPHFAACAARLAWAVETQRARYRVQAGQTRCQAYPSLYTNPRRYDGQQERTAWDLRRVTAYLSQFSFQRKVEKCGQITLFANPYGVGRAYRRQSVAVQLDATTQTWVIQDDAGTEIRRHPAQELSYAQISQLQLGKRRKQAKTE